MVWGGMCLFTPLIQTASLSVWSEPCPVLSSVTGRASAEPPWRRLAYSRDKPGGGAQAGLLRDFLWAGRAVVARSPASAQAPANQRASESCGGVITASDTCYVHRAGLLRLLRLPRLQRCAPDGDVGERAACIHAAHRGKQCASAPLLQWYARITQPRRNARCCLRSAFDGEVHTCSRTGSAHSFLQPPSVQYSREACHVTLSSFQVTVLYRQHLFMWYYGDVGSSMKLLSRLAPL